MNKRLLAYILVPLLIALLSLVLDLVVDAGCTLALSAVTLYMIRMVIIICSLASIVGAFSFFRKDAIRLFLSLGGCATLIVVDYFLNIGNAGSDNLLWLLPMVGVVYVLKYKTLTGHRIVRL